jgi:hypothetical protein
MVFLKSLLVSATVTIVYTALGWVAATKMLTRQTITFPSENSAYVSNGPWIPIWPVLIGAFLVFAVAFYWTFKRISNASHVSR